ncbi:ABC transporter permease [Paenibacillus sp. NPDC058071]|uniref:ABC transporter permease n=1 Tax=Paenibacillus sp. NPDC058071 TaxID=3346326 RepID=UPI0036DDDEE4
MRSILPIAWLLVRRTLGSRRGLLLNVLLPVAVLSLLSSLFVGSGSGVPNVVVGNKDTGYLGAYMVDSLAQNEAYRFVPAAEESEEGIKSAVVDGKYDGALFIPANFTEKLLAGERPQVRMYRMNVQIWNAALETALLNETKKLDQAAALLRHDDGATDPQQLKELLNRLNGHSAQLKEEPMHLGTMLSNPEMIGIMLMFVLMLVGQTVGIMLEDRDQRTMARVYAAPVKSLHIAAGNFLGSVIVGTLQISIMFTVMHQMSGLLKGVPFWPLMLVMECFLLAAVGLATMVGGLVRNSSQLSQMNTLIIVPTSMLGGCFWPLSIMPDFMQKLANFTPQKWAIQAADRLSGGGSIIDIAPQLGILLLFAAVLLAFGAAVLRPNRTA